MACVKITWGERTFDVLNATFLTIFGLTTLYPLLYIFTLSFSTPADALAMNFYWFPLHPTLMSYEKVLAHPDLLLAYVNTVIRTIVGIAISLTMTAIIAYPLSRRTFPHRKLIMKLFVFSMLFSGGTIPMFLLVKNLGLLNTLWALVLPGAVSAFNMIVMRNFFEGIPTEIIESARIDGASEMRVLMRIVLPLSVPVMAVMALWVGVAHWNHWFDALIYTQDNRWQVLQLFLRRTVVDATVSLTPGEDINRIREEYTPESLKAATIMAVTLPILFLYPFIQRYFVKGIMLGSVKG
ncbi:ABC transporter permease [Paenibacillus oryzisoli]|uniref:ABC transporter permease n=1 Tax=Paenibacillus oryzisoli TaxID=1850517 RepID=A0A198A7I8_9BACL|nr:ABC transporter permease [Paenibacillus oryzisoli]